MVENSQKIMSEIIGERHRQITHHGYSQESDLRWKNGELAMAASVYSLPPEKRRMDLWPFDKQFYKPDSNRRTELIKAAALIIAEIERLENQGGIQNG